ncbi:MAG: ROK family protein [Thermoanaerobacteraceae bacterium]|nr:ROK family protein [Thermoanaerobacteraceae bacterium]
MAVVAAVDLGGTSIKGALFSKDGKLLVKTSRPTERDKGYRHVLQNIKETVDNLCREMDIPLDRVRSVGIGVPALMSDGGNFVVLAPNLHWRDREFVRDFAGLVNKPVYCHNDANLAALGEWWQGSGREMQNLLMVTIGTGIGSGLILDGKLYTGLSGMAVEIGHMVVKANDGLVCSCGRSGCVETLTAAPGIVREAKRLAAQHETVLNRKQEIEAKDVYQAAAVGDRVARQVVDRAAYYLGVAVANVLTVLDLEGVIIGGGVASAGDTLLTPLRRVIREQLLFYDRRPVKVVLSQLGNEAGFYGAARWAMTKGGKTP